MLNYNNDYNFINRPNRKIYEEMGGVKRDPLLVNYNFNYNYANKAIEQLKQYYPQKPSESPRNYRYERPSNAEIQERNLNAQMAEIHRRFQAMNPKNYEPLSPIRNKPLGYTPLNNYSPKEPVINREYQKVINSATKTASIATILNKYSPYHRNKKSFQSAIAQSDLEELKSRVKEMNLKDGFQKIEKKSFLGRRLNLPLSIFVKVQKNKNKVSVFLEDNKLGEGAFKKAKLLVNLDKTKKDRVLLKAKKEDLRTGIRSIQEEERFLKTLANKEGIAGSKHFLSWGNQKGYVSKKYDGDMEGKMEVARGDILGTTRQLLTGLNEISKQGLVHRDLKPANVLISNNGKVGICDFGVTETSQNIRSGRSGYGGTPLYTAPEVTKCILNRTTPNYDPSKSDVYAMGCVLYNLIDGGRNLPWGNSAGSAIINANSNRASSQRYLRQQIDCLERFRGASNPFRSSDPKIQKLGTLVQKMLNPDPNRRISSQEALDALNKISEEKAVSKKKEPEPYRAPLMNEFQMKRQKNNLFDNPFIKKCLPAPVFVPQTSTETIYDPRYFGEKVGTCKGFSIYSLNGKHYLHSLKYQIFEDLQGKHFVRKGSQIIYLDEIALGKSR